MANSANGNRGPAEQLYRSVKRDVERARAGRSASSGTPSGTSRNGGSSRSRSKPSKSRSSRRDVPAPSPSSRRDASSSRASSKPRAARAASKPQSSSGRNGLSSRTPAQRAAFEKMIAARDNGASRTSGRSPMSRRTAGRAGRDDNKAWRGNPDRSRINVKEPYEVRYWSRALGVSAQDLVATVRRLGGTPTVQRVRNALIGRDPASRRDKPRAATTRGARDGRSRPFAAGRGSSRGPAVRRGRDEGFVLR